MQEEETLFPLVVHVALVDYFLCLKAAQKFARELAKLLNE
jgi:hypothetical protein